MEPKQDDYVAGFAARTGLSRQGAAEQKTLYAYRTTKIDVVDQGDGSILDGAWIAGECRGVRLGLYVVARQGEWRGYKLTDHIVWRIEHDFQRAGIDPASKRADSLLKSWVTAVRAVWPRIVEERGAIKRRNRGSSAAPGM